MPFKMKGYTYPGKSPIKAKEEQSDFEMFQSMGKTMGETETTSTGTGLAEGLADAGKAFSAANAAAQAAKGDKDDADASRSLSDKNINVVDTSTVGFGTKLGTGLSDKFKTKVDYLKEAKKIKNK